MGTVSGGCKACALPWGTPCLTSCDHGISSWRELECSEFPSDHGRRFAGGASCALCNQAKASGTRRRGLAVFGYRPHRGRSISRIWSCLGPNSILTPPFLWPRSNAMPFPKFATPGPLPLALRSPPRPQPPKKGGKHNLHVNYFWTYE